MHIVTNDSSLHEEEDDHDVTKDFRVRTDVIAQGEIMDEILMEVRRVSRSHDLKERSHDLKHGGFGIQFNNAAEDVFDHVDEIQRISYVVHYGEKARFTVICEVDSGGNFRFIRVTTPVKFFVQWNLSLTEPLKFRAKGEGCLGSLGGE